MLHKRSFLDSDAQPSREEWEYEQEMYNSAQAEADEMGIPFDGLAKPEDLEDVGVTAASDNALASDAVVRARE